MPTDRVFQQIDKEDTQKQTQFVTERTLEKWIVSMFLRYKETVGKRKAICWRK